MAHILIIDDDPVLTGIMGMALIKEGHSVDVAHDGHKGARALYSKKFDLLILDIDLGYGMSGWEVAALKWGDPELRKIPFIIVSGLSPSQVREGGRVNLLTGPSFILNKPIDMDGFLQHVAKAIEAG